MVTRVSWFIPLAEKSARDVGKGLVSTSQDNNSHDNKTTSEASRSEERGFSSDLNGLTIEPYQDEPEYNKCK